MKCSIFSIFVILLVAKAKAFDQDELDIFDLVEEVNQNFYEYLDLTQEASTNDIRKAYRRLSLVLHPDKNDAPDAGLKFRWLASIYEILKDPQKREVYDRVLVEGLPDWRSPVFYYRRMRKIGLAEGLAYLFVIVTVFQYCIYWAHYWERKFTLKENISAQMAKKSAKKAKKTMEELKEMLDDHEREVLGPKPSVWDLLPFQTYRLAKYLIISIPSLPWTLHNLYQEVQAKRAEELRLQREEEEEMERRENEKRERKERKKESRKRVQYEEKTGGGESTNSEAEIHPVKEENVWALPKNANQIWTDVDLAKLAKLIRKYPPGTMDRWERIAEILERLPAEVTKMANKIKNNAYMVPVSQGAQGLTGKVFKPIVISKFWSKLNIFFIGLESDKLVSDDRMEDNYNETDSQLSEDSDYDSSEDEGIAYTVASKDGFIPVEVKTKVKTRKTEPVNEGTTDEAVTEVAAEAVVEAADPWSQAQQKALEGAIKSFPKGTTERWERIANKVPGKTKDQCIQRFKTLAEMVKKKKEENKE